MDSYLYSPALHYFLLLLDNLRLKCPPIEGAKKSPKPINMRIAIKRGCESMTELLDIACWMSLLLFSWYKLWEHVYYREDDNDD